MPKQPGSTPPTKTKQDPQAEPASAGGSPEPAAPSDTPPAEPDAPAIPDGTVGLAIAKPIALGNGTRPRGFVLATCQTKDGAIDPTTLKPASNDVTDDEVRNLAANMHHAEIVPAPGS
ncbi:MAG: hypothetical protein ACPGYV_14905 [Phycisphaeraceae bacterium]